MQNSIKNVVAAIFNLGMEDDFTKLSKSKTAYKFGIFAEQDYRVVASLFWSFMGDWVSLQVGTAYKPPMDEARPGSREHADQKRVMDNSREEERQKKLTLVRHAVACITHMQESLAEKAKDEKEKAGKKEEDGGRVRIRMGNASGESMEFRAYHQSPRQWIIDQRLTTEAGTLWACKLDDCEADIDNLPSVDIHASKKVVVAMFSEDQLEHSSGNAWAKLITKLEELGEYLNEYEKFMERFNLSEKTAEQSKAADKERRKINSLKRFTKRSLANTLGATELLKASDGLQQLIDTPVWKMHLAKKLAEAAQVEAAQADAQAAMAMAQVAQVKSNMQLMSSLELLDEAEAELAEVRAQFAARAKARKEKEAALNKAAATK